MQCWSTRCRKETNGSTRLSSTVTTGKKDVVDLLVHKSETSSQSLLFIGTLDGVRHAALTTSTIKMIANNEIPP